MLCVCLCLLNLKEGIIVCFCSRKWEKNGMSLCLKSIFMCFGRNQFSLVLIRDVNYRIRVEPFFVYYKPSLILTQPYFNPIIIKV